jgi:endonuclease/exonuclease/phosphatase family metal-dependent hydrolase
MKKLPLKRIFKTILIFIWLWLLITYLISSFSSFIPPEDFSFISLFALGYPYILAAFIIGMIICFFVKRKSAYVMLIILPAGYFNFVNTFALRSEILWKTEKDSTTLRVMTWNVQSFANYLHRKKTRSQYRTTRTAMLTIIHDYDPDVLCFQEYRNVENAKRRIPVKRQLDSLGYKYSFCSDDKAGPLFDNSAARVEEGVAIFSKFPIVDSSKININPEKNEHLISADILFNNKPVRIFTAHLQSFTIYADTTRQKDSTENIYEITYKRRKVASYKIRETELKHQEEVNTIRKSIDTTKYPVIYCGDLNSTPASYNYRYLMGKNLQDAFLKKGSGIGNTFYKLGPTLRIDVCLADTAFAIEQCKRERKKLSDHYPVITDLKWKNKSSN